jgi:hypothetical protein
MIGQLPLAAYPVQVQRHFHLLIGCIAGYFVYLAQQLA